MDRKLKIAVLVGSLREKSLSQSVARALVELAQPTLDLETCRSTTKTSRRTCQGPGSVSGRRSATRAAIFVTPECNRSVPGVLKNAIDVGEVYLSNSTKLFDAAGKMISESARSLLEALLQKFEMWIRQFKGRTR